MPDNLHDGLVALEVQIVGGEYSNARLALTAIRAAAETNPAARARLLYLEGWLAAATTPGRDSDELLAQAMRAASDVGDADTFARAAIYRLNSLVANLGALREAAVLKDSIHNTAAWWPEGESVHERFAADFAEARGGRLDAEGDWKGASVALRKSLGLRTARDGDDHPRLAKAHHNLAVVLASDPDRHDEAHRHYIKAWRIRADWYGDDHPYTLESEFGLAQFECEDLMPFAYGLPSVTPDCLDSLEDDLHELSEKRVSRSAGAQPHGHTGKLGRSRKPWMYGRAEAMLKIATAAVLDLQDIDARERSDLLAVRGRLAGARDSSQSSTRFYGQRRCARSSRRS